MKKNFLLQIVGVCLFAGLPRGSITAITAPSMTYDVPQYRLHLFNTQTRGQIDIVYRQGDRYISEALARLDNYLKDRHTGEVRHYDPRVFDLLYDLAARLGLPNSEINVLCGYRSPMSNLLLRRRRSGVALHSLHIKAQAIDIYIPGVTTKRLRDAAWSLRRGGVGYYAKSGFVHVDVGQVRHWRG